MTTNQKERKKRNKEPRYRRLHRYYLRTGFYKFVFKNLRKAFVTIVLVIIAILLFNKYVYNINDGLTRMTEVLSPRYVLAIFFASESFLGILPPEIFIAWSKKTSDPIGMLSVLASLSYVGGIISYFIGKAVSKIERVNKYIESRISKYLKNTKRWGGILIVTGALLPIPFSITCIAAGMINYPLKGVITFGLFRFLRFAFYALLIFQVVN